MNNRVETSEENTRSVEDIFKKALETTYKMAEDSGKKTADEIFKEAFKPGSANGEDDVKSASETFKDIFSLPGKKTNEEKQIPEEEKQEIKKEAEEWLKEKNMGGVGNDASAPQAEKETPPVDASADTETSASETFKDIFQTGGGGEKPESPTEEVSQAPENPEEETPASETFKDIFKSDDTLDVSPDSGPGENTTPLEKIDDQTVQKIIKSNVEGKGILGGFMVVEKDGRPEIILDEGEVDIPQGARVEVIKKDGEIAIIVRKGEGDGNLDDLEKLIGSDEEGSPTEIKDLENPGEMDWTEGQEEDDDVMDEVKGNFDLLDIRKEFRTEKKKEEEEEEDVEEEEQEPSIIDRIFKRVKKTASESKESKLKRMSLENLSRVKDLDDDKKAIVGVAYVLKQFLEVKYEIPHELTYMELINEIRSQEMNNELRKRLISFFKKTSIMVYADKPKLESPSRAYALAERTIKELS